MRQLKVLRAGLSIALGLLILATTACSDTSVRGSESSQGAESGGVCLRATALLEAGELAAAKKLIEEYRQPALDRLDTPAQLPDDPDTAAACEEQWNRALETQPVPSPTNPPQGVAEGWETFEEDVLGALVIPAAWAVAAAAGLVVLARFGVYAFPWSRRRRFLSDSWLIRLGVASFFIIAGGCLCFAVLVGVGLPWWWSALAAAVTLAAAIWCSYWLGARARVRVRVRDKSGSEATAIATNVTRIVHDLGTAPPGGIESPGASDITQLTTSATKVSDNPFIGVVVSLLDFIVNAVPWRAEVQMLDDRRALVVVLWNGHRIRSERVIADMIKPLQATTLADGMDRLIAAVIAVSLAGRYRDMTGLYGAKDWASVGLHDIASMVDDKSEKKALLQKAVDLEPANTLARITLQNEKHREATSGKELGDYISLLQDEVNRLAEGCGVPEPFSSVPTLRVVSPREGPKRKPKPAAELEPKTLLARTLLVWGVMLRNRIAVAQAAHEAPVKDGREAPTYFALPAETPQAVTLLVNAVRSMATESWVKSNPAAAERYLEELRMRTALLIRRLYDVKRDPTLAAMLDAADVRQWVRSAEDSRSKETAYDLACYLAMQTPRVGDDAVLRDRLRIGVPGDGGWAPKDPELYWIRDSHWDLLHPDVPKDIWKVKPLSEHGAKLAEIGSKDLAKLAGGSQRLKNHLGLKQPTFDYLSGVATLALRLESKTDSRWQDRVPLILQSLIAADIGTEGRLLATTEQKLVETIGDDVRGVPLFPQEGPPLFWSPADAVRMLRLRWTRT